MPLKPSLQSFRTIDRPGASTEAYVSKTSDGKLAVHSAHSFQGMKTSFLPGSSLANRELKKDFVNVLLDHYNLETVQRVVGDIDPHSSKPLTAYTVHQVFGAIGSNTKSTFARNKPPEQLALERAILAGPQHVDPVDIETLTKHANVCVQNAATNLLSIADDGSIAAEHLRTAHKAFEAIGRQEDLKTLFASAISGHPKPNLESAEKKLGALLPTTNYDDAAWHVLKQCQTQVTDAVVRAENVVYSDLAAFSTFAEAQPGLNSLSTQQAGPIAPSPQPVTPADVEPHVANAAGQLLPQQPESTTPVANNQPHRVNPHPSQGGDGQAVQPQPVSTTPVAGSDPVQNTVVPAHTPFFDEIEAVLGFTAKNSLAVAEATSDPRVQRELLKTLKKIAPASELCRQDVTTIGDAIAGYVKKSFFDKLGALLAGLPKALNRTLSQNQKQALDGFRKAAVDSQQELELLGKALTDRRFLGAVKKEHSAILQGLGEQYMALATGLGDPKSEWQRILRAASAAAAGVLPLPPSPSDDPPVSPSE